MIRRKFFSEIIGQEKVKKALILNLINPKIGGLLIEGEKGVCKSTLVRSIESISKRKVVELPLGASEDMLIGSLDIEKTLNLGKVVVQKGILNRCNENVLYIDEVNLLRDNLINPLLDVCASKENKIEREGISITEKSDFILIGTMNKEMGKIRGTFLDRFALYVRVESIKTLDERVKIMKGEFSRKGGEYFKKDEELSSWIEARSKEIKNVKITNKILEEIVKICIDKNVEGHRADVILLETIKAITVFNMENEIKKEYIDEAIEYVFPHRSKKEKDEDKEENKEKRNDNRKKNKNEKKDNKENENKNSRNEKEARGNNLEKIFSIGEGAFIEEIAQKKDRIKRENNGRKVKSKGLKETGRCIRTEKRDNVTDIALVESIRKAALYQNTRERGNMAIKLEYSDLMSKVRENKVSNFIVFLVDASASLGVNKRMAEVKGAVLELLKKSYVKRDKIALVTFRNNEGKIILPPTNSVDLGYKYLKEMKTGGNTPLNLGLLVSARLIINEFKKNANIKPILIVISDGKGNVLIDKKKNLKEEMIGVAKQISSIDGIKTLVIDVENKNNIIRFDRAKVLAQALGGQYTVLKDVKRKKIIEKMGSLKNE